MGQEEVGFGVPRRRRTMVLVFREETVRGVGLAGDDVLRDLPSLPLRVCYSDSQPVFRFKAAGKIDGHRNTGLRLISKNKNKK